MRPSQRLRVGTGLALALATTLSACEKEEPMRQPPPPKRLEVSEAEVAPDPGYARMLRQQASMNFRPLPKLVDNRENRVTDAKVDLGRQLYFDTRLSKNHDLSCNSCHDLQNYGVDARVVGGKTSGGHKGAFGDRNSPTVYNAALHISQFWDGRAADVEAQAKGPVLNPVEMALGSDQEVESVLRSIPGYKPMFKAAFPEDKKPITFDNMARAIGAFERGLMTPSRFDEYLKGKDDALSAEELRGLAVFMQGGCVACHNGPAVGGGMYQKLGLMKPYKTEDVGRAKITGNEGEKFFFKVPSLRNVAMTAPYLHDGSVPTLSKMVDIMVEYQTPKGTISPEEKADLLAFLKSLTGDLPKSYIKAPDMLESGPDTPKPDPS